VPCALVVAAEIGVALEVGELTVPLELVISGALGEPSKLVTLLEPSCASERSPLQARLEASASGATMSARLRRTV
jgi:hypothetical protein